MLNKVLKQSNDSKLATRILWKMTDRIVTGSSVPVPTYSEGQDIESYLERLDCYCDLVKAKDEQKVSLLLLAW